MVFDSFSAVQSMVHLATEVQSWTRLFLTLSLLDVVCFVSDRFVYLRLVVYVVTKAAVLVELLVAVAGFVEFVFPAVAVPALEIEGVVHAEVLAHFGFVICFVEAVSALTEHLVLE